MCIRVSFRIFLAELSNSHDYMKIFILEKNLITLGMTPRTRAQIRKYIYLVLPQFLFDMLRPARCTACQTYHQVSKECDVRVPTHMGAVKKYVYYRTQEMRTVAAIIIRKFWVCKRGVRYCVPNSRRFWNDACGLARSPIAAIVPWVLAGCQEMAPTTLLSPSMGLV